MLGTRRCRGALPCAAVATVLAVPVPVALAAGQIEPDVGSVTETAGAVVGGGAVPPVTVPAPTPLAAAATGCAKAHAQPSRLAANVARAAMLCAINRARAAHGLPAFGPERHLRRAAKGHARDMVRHHYFGHQRPGGPSLSDRLRSAGWHGRSAGEAIAWGCGTSASAASTVKAWLHSPPHRAILLSGGYRSAGIGVAGRAPAACGPGATWVLDAGT